MHQSTSLILYQAQVSSRFRSYLIAASKKKLLKRFVSSWDQFSYQVGRKPVCTFCHVLGGILSMNLHAKAGPKWTSEGCTPTIDFLIFRISQLNVGKIHAIGSYKQWSYKQDQQDFWIFKAMFSEVFQNFKQPTKIRI